MDSSMGAGFMAVFAVSGSVVFLSLQIHKRLLSDFMKKIEVELGYEKADQSKKTVRFSPEVVVPSENKGCYRKKHVSSSNPGFNAVAAAPPSLQVGDNRQSDASMPLNWQVLYKGILESRKLSINCI